ncbi:hypothetical protein GW932_00670 [archaeon]|nr:hypothetical protein [archaeon]
MENQLLNFVEKFFKNLGAKTNYEGNILTITNVPASFQKFYGKNEPYLFSTKIKHNPEVEFLEKGGYALKAISTFLENSGQTTLLKINFEIDPEEEIKKNINLKNSRLMKLVSKKKFDIFFRFTFHTSFQYLNEREKIINEIYVHDNKVINGDLKGYPVIEGSKSEIKIPDMKEAYFLSKEELKKLLENKTNEITIFLNKSLEKDTKRIENHFLSEEKELTDNLGKLKEKLKELELEGDVEKIKKQKKAIETIKEKLNPVEREKDKARSIMIERVKHGLNVNNKLFNTTLIYHPIFSYDTTIKNEDTKKIIELNFNPLTSTLEKLKCDVCSSETNEIYLCKNGHVSCKNCFVVCENCGKEYCKKCVITKCQKCSSHICNECKTKCFKCGRILCNSHTRVDKLTARVYCNDCLIRCERCGNMKIGEEFKMSKRTGAKICGECFRQEMQKKVLEGVFD